MTLPLNCEILHGDCVEQMALLIERGVMVDSIVTDPPAGIAFMGKDWDHHKGGRDQWIAWMQTVATKAFLLAKPGAHALVWALPKTSHWTVTGWENAGWEVRDRVSHLFGTGFPKSLDISKAIDKAAGVEREVIGDNPCRKGRKPEGWSEGWNRPWQSDPDSLAHKLTAPATNAAQQWEGWGTALKPAMEDWWLLRKPLSEPTVAANVLKHGVGGLNIGACRIGTESTRRPVGKPLNGGAYGSDRGELVSLEHIGGSDAGRFPANLIHDGSDEVLDAFAAFGDTPKGGTKTVPRSSSRAAEGWGMGAGDAMRKFTDTGSAERFFYSAKASRHDRACSKHPTVKPISLMRYLCRLITPPGGTVLDPFAGSGTTLAVAHMEGFHAIGIEREDEYITDIRRRMDAIAEASQPAPQGGLFDDMDAAE